MTTCGCRSLLGGHVYRDDCPIHSPLPPAVTCPRCDEEIGRRDPRLATEDGPVHALCGDVRERLGLDDRTPAQRQADGARTRQRGDSKVPLHLQPGRMARLRRRR